MSAVSPVFREDRLPDPPPLPGRLTEPIVVVTAGTALWLTASLGLAVAYLVGARPLDLWFTTCTGGWLLGLVGFGIMALQRAATCRGSRGVQRGMH